MPKGTNSKPLVVADAVKNCVAKVKLRQCPSACFNSAVTTRHALPNGTSQRDPRIGEAAATSARPAPRSHFLGAITQKAEAVYKRPSLNLLKRSSGPKPGAEFSQTVLRGTARLLEDVLADFGVKGEVRDIKPGPVVTLYELEPARGTKTSRIISLADDIARSMSARSARVAVVPGGRRGQVPEEVRPGVVDQEDVRALGVVRAAHGPAGHRLRA